MKTILRFQTATGAGAYNCGWDYYSTINWGRHPTPNQDSKLKENFKAKVGGWCAWDFGDWHFGFSDMQQLRAWFYSDDLLRTMHKHGILLTVWRVDDENVVEGNSQTCFIRDTAELIGSYSILEFFNIIGD